MSDNGSAYKSFAFRDLLAERGIKPNFPTSRENIVIEQGNRGPIVV
jgi:transposase InsO family protein